MTNKIEFKIGTRKKVWIIDKSRYMYSGPDNRGSTVLLNVALHDITFILKGLSLFIE